MRPKLELAVSEARTALSRLLRSQGTSDQDAVTALAAVSRADGVVQPYHRPPQAAWHCTKGAAPDAAPSRVVSR